jgi:alpha-galactosidase
MATRMKSARTTAICLLAACSAAFAQMPEANSKIAPTLAQTPPMGWNSWNHFAGKVTQQDVMDAADALVKTGMRDAGYIYVNVDDTWEGDRDAQGVLHTNAKFPDMKALGDSIHARGLKFGIYSSPGPKTCGGYAGSLAHEQQDADLYASWGVDYLKYDLCSFHENVEKAQAAHPDDAELGNRMMREAYVKMRQALDRTGRPIVLSLCQYGWDDVWTWGPSVGGNLWRTTGDISDHYDRMALIGFSQAGLSKYAAPGHWNDPDMLEVGNGGMSADEYRTHMSLWALLAAPLIAGNDLSRMTAETRALLMNPDVIAIDQDRLGRQGDRVHAEGPYEVWSRPLTGGAIAVGLFNRSDTASTASFSLAQVGLNKATEIRNVWTGEKIEAKDGVVAATIPKHGVLLVRITP